MKQFSQEEIQATLDRCKILVDKDHGDFKSIYDFSVSFAPKKKAITYYDGSGTRKSYDYVTYNKKTKETAASLDAVLKDVEKHSVVALKIKNCPMWIHLFWGLLMSGYRPLLIDARLAYEKADEFIVQSQAKAIIVNEENTYSVPSYKLNEITGTTGKKDFTPLWENEMILCTSGTTGNAKMMVFGGNNMAQQITACLNMPKESLSILGPQDISILAMVPLHHIFGFVAVFLWYTVFGKNIVFPNSGSSTDLVNAIKDAKVTHIYSVPLFWDSIAQNVQRAIHLKGEKTEKLFAKMKDYNLHRIGKAEAGLAGWNFIQKKIRSQVIGESPIFCISGGGYLSKNTLETLNGLGYPLCNGIGMSEVGVTSCELSNRVEDRLKCSVGHSFAGITYKVDPANNELLIKSKVIHKEEIIGGVRKKTVLEDGFLRTGDIVSMDKDGRVYIKGRIKEVIINSNGENVYPDELEYAFKELPHIISAAVLGIRAKKEGEEQISLVLELDNSVNNEDLPGLRNQIEALNNRLQPEKRIQAIYISKKAMPLANGIKVKRLTIKQEIEAGSPNFVSLDQGRETIKVDFSNYNQDLVENIYHRIQSIFSKTLLLPNLKIEGTSHWVNDLGGDSMSYVSMVNDFNKEFDLELPPEKYGTLTCLNDFTLYALKANKEQEKGRK